MDMEIVSHVISENTRNVIMAYIILIVVLGGGLTAIVVAISTKNALLKSVVKSPVIIVFFGFSWIIMPFAFPEMLDEAKEEKVKVEGQATLQKYEKVNDNYTVANLKGKDGKVFKIYLDEDEMLNQKEDIKRGDKVRIKSDGMYQLKREGRLFSSNKDGYELEKGSELEKVE